MVVYSSSQERIDIANRLVTIFPDFQFQESQVANDWGIDLEHTIIPEAKLFVTLDRQESKWELSPVWPRLGQYTYRPKELDCVRVSFSRTNQSIYDDVNRRLLTPYYQDLPIQIALRDADVAKEQFQHGQIAKFHSMLGSRIPERIDGDTYYSLNHGVRLLQFAPDGQSVRIETSHIPIVLAERILKLLIKHN